MSQTDLTAEVNGKLTWYCGELQRLRSAVAENILESGRYLSEVRDLLPDSDTFSQWVSEELSYSPRTAYNYIAAFETFGSIATVAIEPSAMYLLAHHDGARKKAIKLAEKGKPVTKSVAQELVEQCKPKTQDAPEEEGPESSKHVPNNSKSRYSEDDQCPNCGSHWWCPSAGGTVCDECGHPHGEPVGDSDDENQAVEEPEDTLGTDDAHRKARSSFGIVCRYFQEQGIDDEGHLAAVGEKLG